MQKIVFFLIFIISGITAFSQQEFFVYFQADNHQPFYARINTKIYSSTETGYMIIPKLSDSVYEIVIGFAKNAYPEQSFPISINRRDRGYQLKNLGEKGWALVNLQNMAIINNTGLPSKPLPEFSGTKKMDAFSELLANVVNDSAILYASVPKPAEPDPVKAEMVTKQPEPKEAEKEALTSINKPVQPVNKEPLKKEDAASTEASTNTGVTNDFKQKTDTVAKTDSQSSFQIPETDNIKKPAIKDERLTEKPFITKLSEKKTDDVYEATYLEQYNFVTDTIKIIIESNNQATATTLPSLPAIEEKSVQKPEQKVDTDERTAAVKPVTVDSAGTKSRAIEITNSDCKNFATEYEVDKLRVKLINDKTIDDKLVSSKKFFKTRCLTVRQIKALTELFPSDETKYRFFDTAYPYVSDTSNFYTLQELIENDYFKNRFRAMILK